MMTDFLLLEEICELNSKAARPALLHQKGVAAKGRFCPYMSLADHTSASFLADPELETPVTVRFSKTMGELGSGDSERDTRGFSVRFHTKQGAYDLICHNFPVYYIKDPAKFPEMVRSLSFSQQEYGRKPNFWKFLSQNPEAMNLAIRLYSDQGTIKSYRCMEGYSVNTYGWVNEQGKEVYVRYRWNPCCEGEENDEKGKGISYQEAEFLAGFSPDCCVSDLVFALEEGSFPAYELEIQMMEQGQAERCGFDAFSVTSLWPEQQFPYMKIGKMSLERILPKEQAERLCFVPSNLIQGVQFANEEFLRIMDYAHKDGGRQRGVRK